MPDAGGRIITRASVRVVPKTGGFGEDLRRKLKKELQKVKPKVKVEAALDNDLVRELHAATTHAERTAGDIEVGTDLDTLGLIPELIAARERAQKAVRDLKIALDTDDTKLRRNALRDIHAVEKQLRDIRVGMDPDTRGVANKLRANLVEIEKRLDPIDVDTEIDPKGIESVNRHIRAVERAAEKLTVNTELNSKGLAAEAARGIETAEKIAPTLEVESKLDSKGLLADAAIAKTRAEAQGPVKWDVELDDKRFDVGLSRIIGKFRNTRREVGALGQATRDAGQQVQNFGKSFMDSESKLRRFIDTGGDAATTFIKLGGSLTAVVSAAGGVVVAAGGILPPIAAAGNAAGKATVQFLQLAGALSVPALVTASTNLVALKTAFTGIGTALAAADPSEFSEAISRLSPEAQRAARELWNFKNSLDMTEVQNSFWQAAGSFENLTNLAPVLSSALESNSAAWGRLIGNVKDYIAEGAGFEATKRILDETVPATDNLTAGFGGLVEGIVNVGGAAAPIFTEMTEKVKDFGTQWGKEMEEKFKSGELEESLRKKKEEISKFCDTVGQVLRPIGGIISTVWGEAAKAFGTHSDTIIEHLERANERIQIAAGEGGIKTWFDKMGGAVTAVLPILGDFSAFIVGNIAPNVADFVTNVAPGFRNFFHEAKAAMTPVIDRLPEFGTALSGILDKIDFNALGTALTVAADAIIVGAPELQKIAPYLDEIALVLLGMKTAATFADFITNLGLIGPKANAAKTALGSAEGATGLTGGLAKLSGKGVGSFFLASTAAAGFFEIFRTSTSSLDEYINRIWPAWKTNAEWAEQNSRRWAEISKQNADRMKEDSATTTQQLIADYGLQNMSREQAMGVLELMGESVDELTQETREASKKQQEDHKAVADATQRARERFTSDIDKMKDTSGGAARSISADGAVIRQALGDTASTAQESTKRTRDQIDYTSGAFFTYRENAQRALNELGGTVKSTSNAAVRDLGSVGKKSSEIRTSLSADFKSASASVGSLRGASSGMAHNVNGHFNGVKIGASNMNRDVSADFNAMTGNIRRNSDLTASGQSVSDSFANGIRARAWNVEGAISYIMGIIARFKPNSPAKEGPLSGKGWIYYSGLSIGRDFAKGITQNSDRVENAIGGMMSLVADGSETDAMKNHYREFAAEAVNCARDIQYQNHKLEESAVRVADRYKQMSVEITEAARRSAITASNLGGLTSQFQANLTVNANSSGVAAGGIVINGGITTANVDELTYKLRQAQKQQRILIGAR